jgi:lipid A disaccharide synthetase
LINIVGNREIIPEFTIENCLEDKIYDCVYFLINNKQNRLKQIEEVKQILWQLGYKNDNFSSELIIKEIENA